MVRFSSGVIAPLGRTPPGFSDRSATDAGVGGFTAIGLSIQAKRAEALTSASLPADDLAATREVLLDTPSWVSCWDRPCRPVSVRSLSVDPETNPETNPEARSVAHAAVEPPVAMTIAGSDSGGGAGIQADLKTFAVLGVFGTFAITAVTAQNTKTVAAAYPLDPDLVSSQVLTVLDDFAVAAVKTGMMATSGIISAVADLADAGRLPNLVVDPVLVSTTGSKLFDDAAIHTYMDRLFRRATVVTPNAREARLLADVDIRGLDDMIDAARKIAKAGPETVVVKGGHMDDEMSSDVVLSHGELTILQSKRIDTPNDHGTGCTLSSATAAYLAIGDPVLDALVKAKAFVTRAIAGAVDWRLGGGHGPLDQVGWNTPDDLSDDVIITTP